jgi:hypothetical protein
MRQGCLWAAVGRLPIATDRKAPASAGPTGPRHAALGPALGNLLTMSYQLGQTIGRLDVLIAHVQMK